MQYKVVPGPKQISGSPEDAAKAFESIINSNTENGWRYHSMETITSISKPGCFSKPVPVVSFMLIFERDNTKKSDVQTKSVDINQKPVTGTIEEITKTSEMPSVKKTFNTEHIIATDSVTQPKMVGSDTKINAKSVQSTAKINNAQVVKETVYIKYGDEEVQKDKKGYWKCSCGTYNIISLKNCMNCFKPRDEQ